MRRRGGPLPRPQDHGQGAVPGPRVPPTQRELGLEGEGNPVSAEGSRAHQSYESSALLAPVTSGDTHTPPCLPHLPHKDKAGRETKLSPRAGLRFQQNDTRSASPNARQTRRPALVLLLGLSTDTFA